MSKPLPTREEYLSPGFNPSKEFTIPHLRNVLQAHNVRYPAAAKKAELVALFESQVAPQASALLAADARVRPSAHGIIAVSENGDEAPVEPPRPAAKSAAAGVKRARTSKRPASRAPTEEPDAEAEAEGALEPVPKKARSRRSTAEPEGVIAATPKKPRKSTKKIAPPPAVEPVTEEVFGDAGPSTPAAPRSVARPRKSQALDALVEPPTPKPAKAAKAAPTPKVVAATPAAHKRSIAAAPAPSSPIAPPKTPAAAAKAVPHTVPRASFAVPDGAADETPKRKPRISIGTDDEGTFSDFNPFQAGSTQAAQAERRRRKSSLGVASAAPAEGKRRAPRPSEWTATSVPASAAPAAPLGSSSLATPTPILRRVSPSHDNLRSPPDAVRDQLRQEIAFADDYNRVVEEKLDLEAVGEPKTAEGETMQVSVRNELAPQRGKGKAIVRRKPTQDNAPTALTIGLSLLVFLLATYYKSISATNGFCDVGSTTNDVIQGRELPIAQAQACFLRRSQWKTEHEGEPETPFNYGEVTQCEPEYILTPHLLAPLSPLVDGWPGLPSRVFPPRCRPDTARMRQVGSLAREVEAELARLRGNVVCAGDDSSENKGLGEKYGRQEKHLRESFADRRVTTLSREQFDELFDAALQDLVEHGDVVESIDVDGLSWYAASRTELTIACVAKMEAQHLVDKWKSQLIATLGVLGAIALFKNQYESARAERARGHALAAVVLKRLQDQEQLHYTDPVTTPQPFLPPAQLRDVVLPASESAAARARMWARVEAEIEKNANVAVSEREVRGDVWKTWEWTGVGQRRVEYM